MPKEKSPLTLKHFQAVQIGLNAYIESRFDEDQESNRDAAMLLNRFRSAFESCSGLSEMLNAPRLEKQPTLERMHEVRMNIYRALGAPGDWGYGTDVGDALLKLYESPAIVGSTAKENEQ